MNELNNEIMEQFAILIKPKLEDLLSLEEYIELNQITEWLGVKTFLIEKNIQIENRTIGRGVLPPVGFMRIYRDRKLIKTFCISINSEK